MTDPTPRADPLDLFVEASTAVARHEVWVHDGNLFRLATGPELALRDALRNPRQLHGLSDDDLIAAWRETQIWQAPLTDPRNDDLKSAWEFIRRVRSLLLAATPAHPEREFGTLRDRCVHSPLCVTLAQHDSLIATSAHPEPGLRERIEALHLDYDRINAALDAATPEPGLTIESDGDDRHVLSNGVVIYGTREQAETCAAALLPTDTEAPRRED